MAELWYFTCEGKQMEPVTSAELKQLASTGFLRPTDMVWKEGMASWVKATSIKGLIPAGAAPSPTAVRAKGNTVAVPSRPRPRDDEEEDRPRRRRREEDDEDDRPARRRKPAKSGMSGLVIGLIVGGGALAAILAVVVVIVVVRSRGPRLAPPVAVRNPGFPQIINNPIPKAGVGNVVLSFTVDLQRDQSQTRNVNLVAGTFYEFRVQSDRVTDVDLFIESPNGQQLAMDISIGPNSFIQWSPPATGNYNIRVDNLDENNGNRSHVTVRSVGVGFVPPRINPGFNPPLNLNIPGATNQEQVPLPPRGTWEKVFTFPQGKVVDVAVNSDIPTNDIDLFISRGDNNQQIASDTRISHTCRLTFTAQAGMSYRFRIINLGGAPANCTLTYTQP